jgi:hypothetical protein
LVAGIQNPELQIRPSDPKPLPEQKEIHLTDIFRAPIKLVRREERGSERSVPGVQPSIADGKQAFVTQSFFVDGTEVA